MSNVKHSACPFCYKDDQLSVDVDRDEDEGRVYAYHVHCGHCGCRGRNNWPIGWCETPEQAWEAWDYRGSVRMEMMPAAGPGNQFSIEQHGPGGQYALYIGRDNFHHGMRLCNLYDFGKNDNATRKAIVEALNNNAHLKESGIEMAADLKKIIDEMRDELFTSQRIISALRVGVDPEAIRQRTHG